MTIFGQDLGVWVIGQTHPAIQLTWADDLNAVIDLTGAAVTGRIAPRAAPPGTGAALANTPTIISAAAGRANYLISATEVANPGQYVIQFVATFPGNDPLYHDPLLITFETRV